IDEFRIMGGGNVAYALTRHFMPYGEFTYFPGIGRSTNIATPNGNVKFNFSVPLSDFHGGVHIRLPIRESRFVPYLVIGAGVVHSYKRTERAVITDPNGSFSVDVPVAAQSDFAVNFGGGIRYYINERFGLRV